MPLNPMQQNPGLASPEQVQMQRQPMPQQGQLPEYEPEAEEYVPKPLERLHSFIDARNIAEELTEEFLNDLGAKVVREYEIDEASREEWKQQIDKAMKIARQLIETKNTPWPNAANFKYPLIVTAAIQFAARAYAEIIKGNDVVKCRVKGEDPTGEKKKIGERVADHMSWQLTEEMEDWEENTDKLLHVLPVIGFVYRKTYFSPLLQRNVSEMVLPDVGVCHYKTKNLTTCRRFTEILTYYKNDIQEFINGELWLDVDVNSLLPEIESGEDSDPPYIFLEQHRWIDLDDDGYAEPYIVTTHKESRKVVRIVARFDEDGIITDGKKVIKIQADEYYTKISFIPAPDGSFYDIGFGILLNAINEGINTLSNQLLDAGTMSNTGGGFISNGVQLGKKPGGTVTFKPNEWKIVQSGAGPLKDAFFPLPVREPSAVLFQLLSAMIQAGKDIAQTQEVNLGGQQAANTPATTALSQVEQGQQVYGAIFKRIYRAFKLEFKKLFNLNVKFGKPRVEFHFKDQGQTVFDTDYKAKSYDIVPVADPKLTSDVQRIARAQATLSISGRPHVDEDVLTGLMLDAVNPEKKAEIMLPPEKWQPTMPQRQMMIEEKRLELEAQALMIEADKIKSQKHKFEADAIFALAKAKDIGDSDSVERLQMFLKRLDEERAREHQIAMAKQQAEQQAAMQAKQMKMGPQQ